MSNQTKDAARERAWLVAVNQWNSSGVEPGSYTAFKCGYAAALARTCKWAWDDPAGVYQTECGVSVGDVPKGYCSHCGGKVEESNEK